MNQPIKAFKAGPISATIWSNQANKDGKVFDYSTVTFERKYQDREGNWKSTSNLRVSDIPKAVLVLNRAFEHLTLKNPA